MKIHGIDPGPDGFAVAVMDNGRFSFWFTAKWPETIKARDEDVIAIEDFTGGRTIGLSSIATTKTIGRLTQMWPNAILIPRIRVARSLNLALNRKRGDAQINRVMCQLYPELQGRKPGLNSHTRAACAVAHAAIGVIQERKVTQ